MVGVKMYICPDPNCGGQLVPPGQRGAKGWMRWSCAGCGSTFMQSPMGAATAMRQIAQEREAGYGNGKAQQVASVAVERSDDTEPGYEFTDQDRELFKRYGIEVPPS